MIEYTTTRYDGRYEHTIKRSLTQGRAVISLIRFELGFGGTVTHITPTKVVVQTPVFGKMDVTAFEGGKEEMRPLVEGTQVFHSLKGVAAESYTAQALELLRRADGGFRPLDVVMFGPMLGSMGYVKPTLLSLICSEPSQMEAALKQPIEEVVAAVEMGLNDNDHDGAIALLV